VTVPAIDILVAGPGGDIEAAYLISRTLRRRFRVETVFVPYLAKSAATLLCLAADEIVLGELGELGPLDAQSPAGSALAPFRLLEQVAEALAQGLQRASLAVQMNAAGTSDSDAAGIAKATVGSILSPIEALQLAAAARALQEAEAFCERLFRRYRGAIYPQSAPSLSRLVRGYDCHGFPIDREELNELGLPARDAAGEEAVILEQTMTALVDLGEGFRLLELIPPSAIDRSVSTGVNGTTREHAADIAIRPAA
jgi:hypothetical protein